MDMRRTIQLIESSLPLPTRSFNELYHVGSLDVAHKRNNGFEGAGLSVSLHPEEWRRIARGMVAGDTWACTRPGNKFIDAHRITDAIREKIEQWAIERGWADRQTTFKVEYYDDELETEVYSEYHTREEAETEAESMETEVIEVPGSLVGTEALRTRTRNRAEPIMVFDLVLTVLAEEEGYDGVWWEDRLDVTALSAPRGVIVPSRVKDWVFELLDDLEEA